MKQYALCFVFILVDNLAITDRRSCVWSKKTAEEVENCPITKHELDERRKMKNCEAFAHDQHCTPPSNFQYHCVINEYENAFIEVCAPAYKITGYCAEYNSLGQRVQLHHNLKCSDVKPPCDQSYKSTDAYLYKGCYDIVEKHLHRVSEEMSSDGNITTSNEVTTFQSIASTIFTTRVVTYTADQEEGDKTVGIIFGVCGLVLLAVIAFVIKSHKGCHCNKRLLQTTDQEFTLLELNNETQLDPSSTSNWTISNPSCDLRDFGNAIENGANLRKSLKEQEANMDEKLKYNRDNTETYLQANKRSQSFEETGLTKKCINQLDQIRVVVLIGKQGCGKTSIANHIMSCSRYDGWCKYKISSWKDLVSFDLHGNSFVLIDDIFDGNIYCHEVQNWWDSLVYFYFEYIWNKDTARLFITAKDGVVDQAIASIKQKFNAPDKRFFVKAEQFPLTDHEVKKIFSKQIDRAKEERNISEPLISERLKSECLKINKDRFIGLPICAHIYAFNKRDYLIFSNPRLYIRSLIAHEIDIDTSHGVKTLFLILLFYHSPSRSTCDLNLENKINCVDFLNTMCSKELVECVKPLQYENLCEKANMLENKLLIKSKTMYEFEHQIYLEGVSDYFLNTYSDAAVKHFPMHILRYCVFETINRKCLEMILERLEKEITTTPLSEILSSKIFEEPTFEKMFCERLRDKTLKQLLFIRHSSELDLQVIFWANKYRLKNLSRRLWKAVEEYKLNEHCQFYLARFGECCSHDEFYIARTPRSLDVDSLKRTVVQFRTSDKKHILHMLVSSDNCDYDAHRFLKKILQESDQSIVVDSNLLKTALAQTECSRLSCIVEILYRMNKRSKRNENLSVPCCVKSMKTPFQELECLVRICILLAFKKIDHGIEQVDTRLLTEQHPHIPDCLLEKATEQRHLELIIEKYIEKCKQPSSSSIDASFTKDIPYKKGIRPSLWTVIKKSIVVQSECKMFYNEN